MTWLRVAAQVVYFRLIVGPTLEGTVAVAGLVGLIVHRSWTSALVFILALATSYFLVNGRLFRTAAGEKHRLLDFLETYQGAVYVRIPSEAAARVFDVSFLIPSAIRPQRLVEYFTRNRLHVFSVKSGTAPAIFTSPHAFVSPIAQDAYIFLRESIDRLGPATRFRLTHELGHAAAIYSVVAKRNLIGVSVILTSIVWTATTSSWSLTLISWTIGQLMLAIIVDRTVFTTYRRRERLNGEIVADYMAMRHLPVETIEALAQSGIAEAIVQNDSTLSDEHTAERRRIFIEQFQRLRRGDPIDIPEVYLKETFSHPVILSVFLCLHLSYICVFAAVSPSAPVVAAAFTAATGVYFFAAIVSDTERRIAIDELLGAPRP